MTHEYVLLTGGCILRGAGRAGAGASAIAWAHGTILAIGSDAEVRAISRGDSRFVELAGAIVAPEPEGGTLEVGGPADLVVSDAAGSVVARVSGGRLVFGSLGDLATS